MILKGSQRGGGRALARHLLNTKHNDHVEVHNIRGLAVETLGAAFLEIEAVSKGTRATQPFFAVAFNPPETANISIEEFEAAFAAVEQKLGLQDQPCAFVFHEKEGRRHAHAVWSRIDVDQMKAIPMNHFKMKLQDVSRDLFIKLGLEMPKGLKNKKDRDPLNYDLPVWNQAKRLKEDPRDLKEVIQNALNSSDGLKGFQNALEAQGMLLARGDKKPFVIIHHTGELLSMKSYSGLRKKELLARLGSPDKLPSVERAKITMQARMTAKVKQTLLTIRKKQRQALKPLNTTRNEMKVRHGEVRTTLKQAQDKRWSQEELQRAKRLRKGLMGLWDRMTGKRGKVSRQNKQEAEEALKRDKKQKQDLINKQMKERRVLQKEFKKLYKNHRQEITRFRYDMGFLIKMQKASERAEGRTDQIKLKDHWKEKPDKDREPKKDKGQGRERTRERPRGPGRGPGRG